MKPILEITYPNIEVISEEVFNEAEGTKVLTVRTKWQQANKINQNNRRYRKEILEREINRIQADLKKGAVYGAGYHPKSGVAELPDIALIWKSVKMEADGSCVGTADVIPTKIGKDAQVIIKAGGRLGLSSRGFGTTTQRTEAGKTFNDVNDDFKLASPGDIVLNPSVADAGFMKVMESSAEKLELTDEELKKEKDKLTLDAIKKHRPDLLEKHKQEILDEDKKEEILFRRFEEAQKSGYGGNFEEYKKLVEKNEPVIQARMALKNPLLEKIEQAFTSKQDSHEELVLKRRYAEAQEAGFVGTFAEWKKAIKKGEVKLAGQDAARSNVQKKLEEAINYTRAEILEKLSKIDQIKIYQKEVDAGEFVGTFDEWLRLKEKQEKEHREKELRALEDLTNKPR